MVHLHLEVTEAVEGLPDRRIVAIHVLAPDFQGAAEELLRLIIPSEVRVDESDHVHHPCADEWLALETVKDSLRAALQDVARVQHLSACHAGVGTLEYAYEQVDDSVGRHRFLSSMGCFVMGLAFRPHCARETDRGRDQSANNGEPDERRRHHVRPMTANELTQAVAHGRWPDTDWFVFDVA